MDLRAEILTMIRQVADENDRQLVSDFGDDTVLLESGLDSLGFAIVVARLEEKLNADPFSAMDQPIYPRTFADFVGIYAAHFSRS